MLLQSAKLIGAGAATIGLAGTGAGIGANPGRSAESSVASHVR